MAKFRKKPVVIEAIQYDGYAKTMQEIVNTLGIKGYRYESHGNDFHDVLMNFWIVTLEGEMKVNAEDWVIKGIQGECYPCKPDIFEATYEEVI